jgi:hypothetical protein
MGERPGHDVSRSSGRKRHNDTNLLGELCGNRRNSRDQTDRYRV